MKYVIGMFDDMSDALRAEKAAGSGIDIDRIGPTEDAHGKLKSYGLSGERLDAFSEGSRRGATLLVAKAPDDRAEEVASSFRSLRSVDIDKRLGRWRTEGYKGYDVGAKPLGKSELETERMRGRDEIHIPVVEEQIAIGKREVESGGVRVATHVTERPVEETVQLRDEKVTVERHKVDRPVTGREDLTDKTIEVHARSEQPVVEKSARVKEEVVITKQAGTHTETIREKVRRSDVDVQPLERTSQERTSRASQDRASLP